MSTPTVMRIMATGHRDIAHRDAVAAACRVVISRYESVVAVAGGAAGADTIWADTAHAASVPLVVILPNQFYMEMYAIAAPPASAEVRFAVERPAVADWRSQWRSQRWWQDNFARNAALVAASDLAVVISPHHPRTLVGRSKGGTAHAVKLLAAAGRDVVWIPDAPDSAPRWVRASQAAPALPL